MFRVQLTNNSSAKNPVAEKIVLIKNYDSLIKQISGKYRIKPQKIRLFVAKTIGSTKVGTEIKNNIELEKILCDDIMFAVSSGENFKRKMLGNSNVSEDVLKKIKCLPRFPYPSGKICDIIFSDNNIVSYNFDSANNTNNSKDMVNIDYVDAVNNTNILLNEKTTNSVFKLKDTNYSKTLDYNFPIFEGNIYNLVKKTTEKYDKIVQTYGNGFVSFDYDDNMAFPEINPLDKSIKEESLWDMLLIRECRGLIISTTTGRVLARRFHKFFNINERNETNQMNILKDTHTDALVDISIYEKLDGVLVSPVLLDDGSDKIIWVTRRSFNEEINNFVFENKIDYDGFSRSYLTHNVTPIFEFCHDIIPASVICYPKKQLVLIALRDNITGKYISIDNIEFTEIPKANKIDINLCTIDDIISKVKQQVGTEGVVIYTKKGNLFKCKTLWYVSIVASQKFGQKEFLLEYVKNNGSLVNAPTEKIFIHAILNDDDITSEIYTLLIKNNYLNQIDELKYLIEIIQQNIKILENELIKWTTNSMATIMDNEIVVSIAVKNGWNADIIADIFSNKSITQKLKNFLCLLLRRQQLDSVCHMLNVEWNSTKCEVNLDNFVIDTVKFENCDESIKDVVLNNFLQKKISATINEKNISDNSIVNLNCGSVDCANTKNRFNKPKEENEQNKNLRIEFQEYPSDEFVLMVVKTDHSNNCDISCENNELKEMRESRELRKISHFYGGILIPSNYDLLFDDIKKSLRQSFETNSLIKLKKKINKQNKNINEYKLFCDLDGVLVDFERGIYELTGKHIEHQSVSKMWQRVSSCDNFFENLKFTSYGKQMWEDINEIYGNTPIILTGVPSSKKRHDIEKKNWCKNKLGNHVDVITCNSSEKHKYAKFNHILIDDRIEIGRQWKSAGGIFVHHITPERTIYELSIIFKKHKEIKCSEELNKFNEINEMSKINMLELTENQMLEYLDSLNNSNVQKQEKIISINIKNNHFVMEIFDTSTNNLITIDFQKCSEVIRDHLSNILENSNILKLCFGIGEHESNLLGSNINNIIDLQEVINGHFENICAKKLINLIDSIESIDPENFQKHKCELLFDIYTCVTNNFGKIPAKKIYDKINVSDSSSKSNRQDYNINIPVNVLFSGIFLTEKSKKCLMEKYIPHFRYTHLECAIFVNNKTDYNAGTELGKLTHFKIIHIIKDENVEIAICEHKNLLLWMVISSKLDSYDIYDVSKFENIMNTIKTIKEIKKLDTETILLSGIFGVLVQQEMNELKILPEKIQNKIINFKKNAHIGDILKFQPNELSSSERSIIHEYARNNNLSSESTGSNTERQLKLTMKKKTMSDNCDKIKFKVCDEKLYKSLSIIKNGKVHKPTNFFSASIEIQNDGTITNNFKLNIFSEKLKKYLTIEPISDQTKQTNQIEQIEQTEQINKKLIIIRGLSGSGKSTLSNYLFLTMPNAEICSADHFFENENGYIFDSNLLNQAHDNCWNKCIESIKNNCETIIIDNTNSTIKEYNKYINLGTNNGYNPIILELFTETEKIAKEFTQRSTHNVSLNSTIKMFMRWETDDRAFLVKPFTDMINCYNLL